MNSNSKVILKVLLAFFLAATTTLAQEAIVMGRVIESNSTDPIAGVTLSILGTPFSTTSAADGTFYITNANLPLGEQVLWVSKSGFLLQKFRIVIQLEIPVNLDPILLETDLAGRESEIGLISLTDSQLNQDQDNNITNPGLLQASNDAFLNAAAFDFSATFFRPGGYDSANGEVLINGIAMNKLLSGRPQWSNWGGLNQVLRNREFSVGLTANSYTFGALGGTTNFVLRASKFRQGGRVSFAMANRSYQGRVMASYNSGLQLNGWAYSVLVSRRFGDQGFVAGTFYRANSFFAAVEKQINSAHSLNLSFIYTPNSRGRSAPLTQEIKNLKGRDYNPNWGWQDGERRNSRVRHVKEPIIMLNHFWEINRKTSLNINMAYQFGYIGNTRIDNGGTRLVTLNGQEAYLGGASNPSPDYYQRLPSFFLQDNTPTPLDAQQAFWAQESFKADGQLDWTTLYRANQNAVMGGGNSVYVLQEDRISGAKFTANAIFSSSINQQITLNSALNYRVLWSENYALINDLLGGTGYLDVDFFAQEGPNTSLQDIAQSDLRYRNRIVTVGDRYKYNYKLNAQVISGFTQAQFTHNNLNYYLGLNLTQTQYQRIGLFENGNFPGAESLGPSKRLGFFTYGLKAGALLKITGRHSIDFNAAYFTKAPNLRNSFNNPRQQNSTVIGIQHETILNSVVSYRFRSPTLKARVTGYYTGFKDAADLGFYFTQDLSGLGFNQGNAFVQEILTGINKRHIGLEFGIEAHVLPTLKLKAAAGIGQFTYTNNPTLYLTSDDFIGPLRFGDGTTKLASYHVAAGPERAYQLGLEYRDPEFWWVGITANYFSNAYIDIAAINRSANFTRDYDGQTFNDYHPETAQKLLKQEELAPYFLVNIIGGKSWRIRQYYVGFFATINNVLDQEYTTGGFEQSRNSNYRSLLADRSRPNGPIFGNRYFFGNGTTYYLNFYVRF